MAVVAGQPGVPGWAWWQRLPHSLGLCIGSSSRGDQVTWTCMPDLVASMQTGFHTGPDSGCAAQGSVLGLVAVVAAQFGNCYVGPELSEKDREKNPHQEYHWPTLVLFQWDKSCT